MNTFDTMKNIWDIWIDTGGTFTDGIGCAPDGALHRVKVLSNSRLRGKLLQKIAPAQFRFSHRWKVQKDIFRAYDFYLTGNDKPIALVQTIDFKENILCLSTDFPLNQALDFEITAHEEAPVLATRILTQTALDEAFPPIKMRLGSTKGTNALLEKKGAAVTLFITKGFKDLLYIGTQQRPDLFQLDIPEPALFYSNVVEVEERLDAQGKVLKAMEYPDATENWGESAAVAFLHAYRNPAHEQQFEAFLLQKGMPFITLSSALSPSIKILPRAQTAVVNAYLMPLMQQYLKGIQANLKNTDLLVMTSAGGLIPLAAFQPKDSLLSGPAGGVAGAAYVAQKLGFQKVLTFDMGGTSTDAARYDNGYDYQFVTKVAKAEILGAALAIETVAAGGGSICWFDGHKLCVGPQSAGASPGPACYGAGGPLTITDINLLLGKLDAAAMGIPIHFDLAQKALVQLQVELSEATGVQYEAQELLQGFEAIANEKMADAIRKISVAKGFDTKDYALLAFGGAGGLHACKIADLLAIKTVILPYDGGLLSAYGIGKARVERIKTQQILRRFDDCAAELPDAIQQLEEAALSQLRSEGFDAVEVRYAAVYLRFLGQDSPLEIPFRHTNQILFDFKSAYQHLFGYYPLNRVVEVESIKVIAATAMAPLPKADIHPVIYNPMPFKTDPHPVFLWEDLTPGAAIKGPALLLNPNSAAFVEPGWAGVVQSDKNIVLQKIDFQYFKKEELKEAVELELFTNRFMAIAVEMGAQLQRTAFSVNIKERLDFSCAILDPAANLLVNAPHIPVHLGSLGVCARLVREKIHIGKNDVIITNHPRYGGSHLPDITLLSAVYSNNDELIGYVANRAHHAEIGGKRPGSMPPDAKNLLEEGVVIPPMYLVKEEEVQWETIEHLLRAAPFPTRALMENLADINAALASLRTGTIALQQLVQTHGLAKVHHYMEKLKQTAAFALEGVLEKWDNRIFTAEEKLDDGYLIRVKIACQNKQLHIDFAGTSDVHPGNLNANISIVYSAVIYVLRLLCDKDIPLNEGLLQRVHIAVPTCLLHPDFSDDDRANPAVVGGNTEVSQRLVDTLLKAFEVAACSQGTMNNFLFGNERFGYYETIGGGTGASAGSQGRSAIHQHMTNTKITDPEELEWRYPVRLNRFEIRKNSGGRGKWQGGNGIIREMEFLEELEITILSQHRKEAPYGINGGENGQIGQQFLIAKDGTITPLQGIDSQSVKPGDRVIIETPGGGGWGKIDETTVAQQTE